MRVVAGEIRRLAQDEGGNRVSPDRAQRRTMDDKERCQSKWFATGDESKLRFLAISAEAQDTLQCAVMNVGLVEFIHAMPRSGERVSCVHEIAADNQASSPSSSACVEEQTYAVFTLKRATAAPKPHLPRPSPHPKPSGTMRDCDSSSSFSCKHTA